MFRIYFKPKGANWVIQFLRWELFWVTVRGNVKQPNIVGKEGPLIIEQELTFDTYDQAMTYVQARGIDKAYAQKESSFRTEEKWVRAQ